MVKAIHISLSVMIFTVISASCCHGQAVFLARKALGAVQHLTSTIAGSGGPAQQEAGSVLLAADADKVYATAVRIIEGNPKFRIAARDDGRRTIDFTDGKREAVLKVSQLQENIAQILVSSVMTPGGKEDPSLVVSGILQVCREMNIQCSPAGN